MTRAARRKTPLRFVTARKAEIELAPWGKHWWLSKPGSDRHQAAHAGAGHDAARHRPPVPLPPGPRRDHLHGGGVAEQWVDREKRTLKAGECAFIPENVVHAIHNVSKKPMTFLAILSPAEAPGRS